MKHTKVIISLLVGASLVFGAGSALAADATTLTSGQSTSDIANPQIKWDSKLGTVKEVDKEGKRITIETSDQQKQEIILNISEETLFVNNKTGLKSSLSEVKVGESISVAHSLAMTRSLPPQTAAIAIITNMEGNGPFANLIEVGQVTNESGVVKVHSADGSIVVTIPADKPITMLNGAKIQLTPSDIKVGDTIFAWYNIVALSYPGQTSSERTVIAKQATQELPKETTDTPITKYGVTINGKALDLKGQPVLLHNDELMVPLRLVSEALGFTLKWDTATMTAAIDDGTVKTRLTIGENSYYKASSKASGLTASFQYANAPLMYENHAYVPAQLFNLLYSNQEAVKTTDSVIAINNK